MFNLFIKNNLSVIAQKIAITNKWMAIQTKIKVITYCILKDSKNLVVKFPFLKSSSCINCK